VVVEQPARTVAGQDLRAGYRAMQPALSGRGAPPIVAVSLVAGLAAPGALVEISAIAALP